MRSILHLLLLGLGSVLAQHSVARNDVHAKGLVRVGPWGTAYSDGSFDDRAAPPIGISYRSLHLDCRWGDRLDYIKLTWFEKPGPPLAQTGHGNPNGGSYFQYRMLENSDDIQSMAVHVCTGSRNKGKVCGVYFTFKGQEPFACGVMNPKGLQPTYTFDDSHKFWGFIGTTQNQGKTLTSLGWLVLQPE